jgi:hypothetical protein
MGQENDVKIVLGSLRYKSAPELSYQLNVPLKQNSKLNIEFDRSQNINLLDVFDSEREKSTTFRPSTKITFLFKNTYVGETNYTPFKENLYYVNSLDSSRQACNGNAQSVYWSGYPLYNEFDLIRTDNDTDGYTQPNTGGHINFVATSATTYNWNFFMSYAYQNVNKSLFAIEPKTQQTLYWMANDGIPFIIDQSSSNGQPYVTFRSVCNHGLSVGEFVELSISYNGSNLFEVSSIGDGTVNSEFYIFSIANIGFSGTTFDTGVQGTAKRVLDADNPTSSRSEYYIRKHKILTNNTDAVIVNAGFELNPFKVIKQYEPSGLTPNFVSRVSIKEGSQSYNLSFSKDISIENLIDNQQRPVSELFFTYQWVGYLGWTNKPSYPIPPATKNIALRQGFDFNLPSVNGQPNDWWTTNAQNINPTSFTNTQVDSYIKQGKTFYYNKSLKSGDTLDGDFCEWNDLEYSERVISDIYHKITYNDNVFDINITGESIAENPLGFYYKPHLPIQIRAFSSYVEEGAAENTSNIPNYAVYNTSAESFVWRDIYEYGFIDNDGVGVDFPFLNGAHYPYKNSIFRLIPEGSTSVSSTLNTVTQPTIDECE